MLPLTTTSLTSDWQPERFGTMLAPHGILVVPLTGSTAPAPFCDTPLMVWKKPPSTTWESSGATFSEYTVLSSAGAHGSRVPDEVIAPAKVRAVPFSLEGAAEIDRRPVR